jgi:ribonucleoside-diphosphate reductase alpha chain
MYSEEEVRAKTLEYFGGDELATNVFMTKYCLKDKQRSFTELTPDEMHVRMAKEFARMEAKFGGSDALSYEEIYELLRGFNKVVPQGSPMMGIGNNYVNVSLSNCVVVDSPADNISSIMDGGKHLANLFKRRCGVGLDLSNLRPQDTPVNNSAGTTTGAWSFADFYSYVCRMIGQNGRRGALMISLDVRHPDVLEFIKMKQDLTKVTGANVSVRITDDFMNAVMNDGDYELHFPVGAAAPQYTTIVKARDVWQDIVESATKTAEPGILMWDNITKNLPAESYSAQGFKTLTTNPCGEIPLSAYDSCRLISVNLKNFVKQRWTEYAHFDLEEFADTVRKAMRLSDDLVELETEKLEAILRAADTDDERELWTNLLEACTKGRRTGLGTHGLADAIAGLGMAYDSPEALEVIDRIYETLKVTAYSESVELAKQRGAFPVFDWETECDNGFIQSLPQELQDAIKEFGRRNISILTNAPTGSVSIMSQTSSGLEPVFRNWYTRRRKLSHNETDQTADFVDELGDRWKEFKVFHHNVREYLQQHRLSDDQVPAFFTESDGIDWQQRVKIQAAIQQHIDHSISSTINLPKGTDPSTVGELYLEGWKLGLKGITVYVDGSRSGVLVTEEEGAEEAFPQHAAPKRPKELPCDIHHTTIGGEKWVFLIGLWEGKPYEVMGGLANLIEIPRKYKTGMIVKHPRKTMNSVYDLRFGEGEDEVLIKNVVKVFDNPNNSIFTRMISLSLRHGAKINYVVEQLQKNRESDMFSFSRCIARILKNYIKDGERASEKTCPSCGAEGLIYVEGCATCTHCGYAKCG